MHNLIAALPAVILAALIAWMPALAERNRVSLSRGGDDE